MIVRRERPHHGAQLSFTDHDGYRFQAILTDQTDRDIAVLQCRHRQHAHVEDRIRDDKDTGLSKFPFKEFGLNEVWLEIVAPAHDLIVWTQALIRDGELANAEPKRLRYRNADAAWLPAAARLWPARVLRPARQAPPAARLAMGRRTRDRIRQAQRAPSRHGPTAEHRPTQHQAASPATRAITAARTRATQAAVLRNRPARPRSRPTTPRSPPLTASRVPLSHSHALAARSGLAVRGPHDSACEPAHVPIPLRLAQRHRSQRTEEARGSARAVVAEGPRAGRREGSPGAPREPRTGRSSNRRKRLATTQVTP